MGMDRLMKIGIIGTGVGIRTHLKGLRGVKGTVPIGVVGTSVDRTRDLLIQNGEDSNLATTWEKLLENNPDIICITTPLSERINYLKDLSNYSGSLIIEKPLVFGRSDGAELRSYIPNSYGNSFVNFQLRGICLFQKIRLLISSGELGDLYSICLFERTSAFRRKDLAPWMRKREMGGGQTFAMGSHLLDLAIFLSGLTYSEFISVPTSGAIRTPRGEWKSGDTKEESSDEFSSFNLRSDKCDVQVSTTSISSAPRTLQFRIECSEGTVEFVYRNGIGVGNIYYGSDKIHETLYIDDNGEISETKVTGLNPSIFRIAYANYMKHIVSSVISRNYISQVAASLDDGINNSVILEKIP